MDGSYGKVHVDSVSVDSQVASVYAPQPIGHAGANTLGTEGDQGEEEEGVTNASEGSLNTE